MLGHEVTKTLSEDGLPTGTIDVTLTGSAGQSFGAFMPAGITLRSRATPTTTSARDSPAARSSSGRTARNVFAAERNVIAGNVIGYGATRAACSCAAWWASASSSATPARPPSSRAWATTRSST